MKEYIDIRFKDGLFLKEDEMSSTAAILEDYFEQLKISSEDAKYETHESSVYLPLDPGFLEKSRSVQKELGNGLKYIVVVGIGGSNLGAQAVYEAVRLKLDILHPKFPRLIFADTTNPREMELLKNFIQKDIAVSSEIVLNIITKSGTTTETIANSALIFDALAEKFGESEAIERTVITTDENSALWSIAVKKKIKVLSLPEIVGGRYSVFSSVGIFPLALAGINVQDLLLGACDITEKCLLPDVFKNPALLGAVSVFLSHRKDLKIYNNFFFNSELESLGKWWRQLTAESLGKNTDKEGNIIFAGVTPIVSIGSTDLHSVVQLYLGGPKDKFTNFIHAKGGQSGRAVVPASSPFSGLVSHISGKDFSTIMNAILEGTKAAYKENNLSFLEVTLPAIDEYSIGQYMQMKMIETMLLAKLWNIDAFNQPDVESYKKVTKELLKSGFDK